MENKISLAHLSKNISNKLLESMTLIDILQDIIDGEAKSETVVSVLKKNITNAFQEIEQCRQMIYIID